MQKKVHLAFGVFCALAILYIIDRQPPMSQALLLTAAAYIAAALPDWDLIIPFMKHRGISHSLLALVVVFIVAIGASLYFSSIPLIRWFMMGFPIGYLSHLIADSLTDHRVAWLQPFDDTAFGFRVFNTSNGMIQSILTFLLWSANGVVFYLLLGVGQYPFKL